MDVELEDAIDRMRHHANRAICAGGSVDVSPVEVLTFCRLVEDGIEKAAASEGKIAPKPKANRLADLVVMIERASNDLSSMAARTTGDIAHLNQTVGDLVDELQRLTDRRNEQVGKSGRGLSVPVT